MLAKKNALVKGKQPKDHPQVKRHQQEAFPLLENTLTNPRPSAFIRTGRLVTLFAH